MIGDGTTRKKAHADFESKVLISVRDGTTSVSKLDPNFQFFRFTMKRFFDSTAVSIRLALWEFLDLSDGGGYAKG